MENISRALFAILNCCCIYHVLNHLDDDDVLVAAVTSCNGDAAQLSDSINSETSNNQTDVVGPVADFSVIERFSSVSDSGYPESAIVSSIETSNSIEPSPVYVPESFMRSRTGICLELKASSGIIEQI